MEFISKPKRTAELCRLMRISENYLIFINVKLSIIEIENICFMHERKSFHDLYGSEVFDDTLIRKLKKNGFILFHLKWLDLNPIVDRENVLYQIE